MGRLEKIVVVTVLFLVAVILGISLNSDAQGAKNNPVAGAGRGAGPRRADKTAQAPVEKAAPGTETQAGGVMNTALVSEAKPAVGAPSAGAPPPSNASAPASNAAQPLPNAAAAGTPPAALTPAAPASQYLVSSAGLEATRSEDFMLYTWKQGDTLASLAQRLYGSPLHVNRIKVANEGRDEKNLAVGDKLVISVKPTAAENVLSRTPPKNAGNAAPDAKWSGGPYTVKAGDVLGTISSQVYGTSKQWKKIYDANRDVIGDDPNRLKVGSKLRIPE